MKDLKAFSKLSNGWYKLHPYIVVDDLSWDTSEQSENGDLTMYYFDEYQQEILARLINGKINKYIEDNLSDILAEAKEYVGKGKIVQN
jgi:hypothetical protein